LREFYSCDVEKRVFRFIRKTLFFDKNIKSVDKGRGGGGISYLGGLFEREKGKFFIVFFGKKIKKVVRRGGGGGDNVSWRFV